MLQIKANKQYLNLSDDIQLDFKFLNPVFSSSIFQEAYSYSFNLPYTMRNREVFRNNKEIAMQIVYDGFLLQDGFAIVKLINGIYTVDFKSNSVDYKQIADSTLISDLDLGTIPIWDDVDPAEDKIDKWYAHMMQTVIEGPETGTHKFPPVGTEKINRWFINRYAKNFGYLYQNLWNISVSPCPRIAHIFDTCFKHLGLEVSVNELTAVKEYMQCTHFSLLVLDNFIQYLGNWYNVHFQSIELNKYVPKISITEFLQMVDELFGISILIEGKKVSILLKKNQLKQKIKDVSRYASKSFENVTAGGTSFFLSYDLDLTYQNQFGALYWYNYEYVLDASAPGGIKLIFETDHSNKYFSSENVSRQEERKMSYIPLKTRSIAGSINVEIDPSEISDASQYDNTPYYAFAIVDKEITSFKDVEGEADFFDKSAEIFLLGLVRGRFPILNKTTNFIDNKLVVSNLKNDLVRYDNLLNEEITLGDSSLYIYGEDSHINYYKKDYFAVLVNDIKQVQTLWLPIQEILKTISWKDTTHLVRTKKTSFIGVVSEVNFTLTKNSISSTDITYMVKSNEQRNASFNGDFDNSFEQ